MSRPTTYTEQEMLRDLSNKDIAAFETLVKTYFPVLCAFAAKYLSDASQAKDIVQETFINFWNHTTSFDNYRTLKSFLFLTTRNGCLNLIRKMQREEDKYNKAAAGAETTTGTILTDMISSEVIALIYQEAEQLPDKMKEIFYLSFEEGMSIAEIAVKLNITSKTVRNQKYNALQLLRGKLRNNPEAFSVILFLLGR